MDGCWRTDRLRSCGRRQTRAAWSMCLRSWCGSRRRGRLLAVWSRRYGGRMVSLRRILRGPDASVRSLAVQANEPHEVRQTTVFEVLTQHLLYRLTHNEALGEDTTAKLIQVVYMLALPGVLLSLYLVALYHPPKGMGPRPYWSQV